MTSLPRTGAELASLYYSAQWCAKHIPDFARRFRKIKLALESMYTDSGQRTSKSIARKRVEAYGITDDDTRELVDALHSLASLATRRVGWQLVLMSDASNVGYGGVLLQVPPNVPIASIHSRDDAEPLAYFGGVWNATQVHYPTYELEALAVLKCVNSGWYWINDGTTLHVLTDNKALTHLFDPTSDHVASKDAPGRARLLRWIATFKEINANIAHVAGIDNLLADLLSRGHVHTTPTPISHIDHGADTADDATANFSPAQPARVHAVQLHHALRTVTDPAWINPHCDDISNACGPDGLAHAPTAALARQHAFTWDPARRLYVNSRNLVLVPALDNIQIKLMILAHCGPAGHHGSRATLANITPYFWWPTLARDVHNFVQGCIHCKASSSPR